MIRMETAEVMLRCQAFANSEKCREIINKMKANMSTDFPIPAIEEAAWHVAKSAPRESRKTLIEIANKICEGSRVYGRISALWQIAFVGAVFELIRERAGEMNAAAAQPSMPICALQEVAVAEREIHVLPPPAVFDSAITRSTGEEGTVSSARRSRRVRGLPPKP
jgi:hypothetical protein